MEFGGCEWAWVSVPEPQEGMPAWTRSAFCFVLPYFAGAGQGRISLYARGEDYHRVAARVTQAFEQELRKQHPHMQAKAFCDSCPFDERKLALSAGLGVRGLNGLLLHPRYGSYVFLAELLTDLSCSALPAEESFCERCGNCLRACPTQALGENGTDTERCLSALTQKKGSLSPQQEDQIRQGGMVWGCDRCQLTCPHNQKALHTPLTCFSEDLLCDLSDLPQTNGEFQRQYAGRAFTWRGKAPLERNMKILDKKE